MTQQICYLEVLNTAVSRREKKKGQLFCYESIFTFHRNPLTLTPIYHELVSPLLWDVFLCKCKPASASLSIFGIFTGKTHSTENDRYSTTDAEGQCRKLHWYGNSRKSQSPANKTLSKGRMWHALSRCLSLTALFLKDPINIPEIFIRHTLSVAGISPCYLEG